MRSWAGALLLVAAAAGAEEYALPEAPAGAARFQADRFEWRGSTAAGPRAATMRLSGDVEVVDSTWTIRAQELRLDMERGLGWADGFFALDDGASAVAGEGGEYDFRAHEGTVRSARGEYPPWRIWARRASVDAERRGDFRRSVFTSCDANPPHYHFRASRVKVSPKKWIRARNAVFFVGRVPVFYTPVLWKSLRPNHLIPTRVQPGYDRRNGAFLRTTTGFSVSESTYGKLYLDAFAEHGLGVGAELQRRASEDSRGALFGYRVKDGHTGKERWTLLGDQFSTLPSSFSVQGRLQVQSDSEFNNHFQRSNAFRVAPELINGGALTRSGTWGTTRILYSRRDLVDGRGIYQRDLESLPRAEFQGAPFSLGKSPVLYTASAFADNSFSRARGFQQKSAGAGLEATRTRLLAPGLSVTPRAAFRETFEDRRDAPTSQASTMTYRDAFTGVYEAGTNVRLDSRLGAWDATYAFARRFKPGTFKDDAGALDYGIEANRVGLQDTLRPGRRVLLRLGGGYDFRRFRDRDPGFRGRVEPMTADAIFLKGPWQITARDQYVLADGNQALILQADRGDRLGTFAGVGAAYNAPRADELIASTEFGWAPSTASWRLGGALRYVARSLGGPELAAFRVFEKELSAARDFHDFHGRVLFRIRPGGVKEFQVRVELRFGEDHKREVARRDWESEWFPWRRKDPGGEP